MIGITGFSSRLCLKWFSLILMLLMGPPLRAAELKTSFFQTVNSNSSDDLARESINNADQLPLTLEASQRELLKGRSLWKDGFVVRVLKGRIDGEPKSIVILGESHFKSSSSSAKAEDLINQFNFYGFEGIDSKLYWAEGEPIGKVIDSMSYILGRFMKGSSISEAYAAEDEGEASSQFCFQLQNDFESGRLGRLEELMEANRSLGSKALSEKMIERVYKIISEKKNCDDFFSKAIYLEEGYQPKIQDNLAFVMYPLLLTSVVTQKCTAISCQRWPQVQLLRIMNRIPLGIFRALSVYLLADITSRLIFGQNDWLDSIFVFSTGVYYNRNTNMTDNIIKGFQQNPNRKNMLVLMGMAHVSAIKEQLISRYGFVPVSLDEGE